jgi:predicted transcriptional regulator YdeE
MQPKFVKRDKMLLVGLGFYGDPFKISGAWSEENEIGRLWQRFMPFLANKCKSIPAVKDSSVYYELHIVQKETMEKGYVDVFVGTEVEKIQTVPLELLIKLLPPTEYAVFTLRGKEITADWPQKICTEWLPASGYEFSYSYSLQVYDKRFKGMDNLEQSEIDVYFPVKKKKSAGL